MKQSIFTIALLASSLQLAQAAEPASVDASLAAFTSSILGTWQPLPGSVSNDKPDVDKSLSLFADSILGKTQRHKTAASNDMPNVDKSIALFTTSIFSKTY